MISAEQRKQSAQHASAILTSQPLFAESQHIACYIANDNEFFCQPMMEAIWRANKLCYLPVLSQKNKNFLEFAAYQPNDILRPNRYHILEPENTQKIAVENLDFVLVPLVAFDLQGNRLGMGGGYYDRTFEFLQQKSPKKPLLIGLAYEIQRVDALPCESWDIMLNGVLTEKQLFFFNKK